MEKVDFLPIGSVVVINGGIKKFMITGRGLNVKTGDKIKYFDYSGCPYPEGITSDRMVYFHHSDIMKVIFDGYDDEDNKSMVVNLNKALETSTVERADIKQLKEEMEKKNDG